LVNGTTTNNVGIFGVGTNGFATGGWGQNGGVGEAAGQQLVPLTDSSGGLVSVALSGTQTVRVWFPSSGDTATIGGASTTLQNGSRDWDFLLFTPAVTTVPAPTLQLGRVGGKAVITYTGTLASSPTVNGAYKDVTGATSPYTVPAGAPTTFFRSHN